MLLKHLAEFKQVHTEPTVKMFLVGLTGGIASGKSTVSNIFAKLGCPIVDADKIAREVVQPGKPAWHLIMKHFGRSILLSDGTIDRPKLGSIIFADESKRKLLNSCTHPYIQREMLWQIFKYFFQGHHFIILDVPLLLDGSALKSFMNQIVVVYCDQQTQLNRLISRNNLNEEEAQNRIHSQVPLVEKCHMADHVIDNSGSLESTKEAVTKLHQTFVSSNAHWKLRSVVLAIAFIVVGLSALTLRSLL